MSRVAAAESQPLRGGIGASLSSDSGDDDSYDEEPWDVPQPHSQDSAEQDAEDNRKHHHRRNEDEDGGESRKKMRGSSTNDIGDLPALSISRSDEEEVSKIKQQQPERKDGGVLKGERTMRPLNPPSQAGMPGSQGQQDRDDVEYEDEDEEAYPFDDDDYLLEEFDEDFEMPMDERMDYQKRLSEALCVEDAMEATGGNLCSYTLTKMGEMCGGTPTDGSPKKEQRGFSPDETTETNTEDEDERPKVRARQDIPWGVDEQTAIEVEYVEPEKRAADPPEVIPAPPPPKKGLLHAFSRSKLRDPYKDVKLKSERDPYKERADTAKSPKHEGRTGELVPPKSPKRKSALLSAMTRRAKDDYKQKDAYKEAELTIPDNHYSEPRVAEDRQREQAERAQSPERSQSKSGFLTAMTRRAKEDYEQAEPAERGRQQGQAERVRSPERSQSKKGFLTAMTRRAKEDYEQAEPTQRDRQPEQSERVRSPERSQSKNGFLDAMKRRAKEDYNASEPTKQDRHREQAERARSPSKNSVLNAMTQRAKDDYKHAETAPRDRHQERVEAAIAQRRQARTMERESYRDRADAAAMEAEAYAQEVDRAKSPGRQARGMEVTYTGRTEVPLSPGRQTRGMEVEIHRERSEAPKSPRREARAIEDDRYQQRADTAKSPGRSERAAEPVPPKSPKRKSALLNAMTRRAKEDYEKGKGQSPQPTSEESSPPDNNAYSSFSQSEKRKFLKLINSGLTPSDATKQVVDERASGEAAMEQVGEGSSSKNSNARLAFWKRKEDDAVPRAISPEETRAAPSTPRSVVAVEEEEDSRFAKSGIGYYDAVRKETEESPDDEDEEEESRDEEVATANRRGTMTKKKSFLPKFVRKGFSPLDRDEQPATEKKSRGSILGRISGSGPLSPQKLNDVEDSPKDITQETALETPDRSLPLTSPAGSDRATQDRSLPMLPTTFGREDEIMEPPSLRKRSHRSSAAEPPGQQGLPPPVEPQALGSTPQESRGLDAPVFREFTQPVEQQAKTVEASRSDTVFRPIPRKAETAQSVPSISQTFSDESLLDDDDDTAEVQVPEEKKEEASAASSKGESTEIEEAMAAQLLGTSPGRSAPTSQRDDTRPEKAQPGMNLNDLDLDVETYFNSTELMSSMGAESSQDHHSVVSSKSYKTSATHKTGVSYGTNYTNGTNYTTSTRSRRPGAAKTRLAVAKQAEQKQKKSRGWQESIQAAAANANRKWDPQKGWVDYVDPDAVVEDRDMSIGEKIHIPINRVKRPQPEKEEEKEEVPSSPPAQPVPFPSEWKEERSVMLQRPEDIERDVVVQRNEVSVPLPSEPKEENSAALLSAQAVDRSIPLQKTDAVVQKSRPSPSKPSPARKVAAEAASPPKSRGWVESMKAATANLGVAGKKWDPDRGWVGIDDDDNDDSVVQDRYGGSISVQAASDTQDFGMVITTQAQEKDIDAAMEVEDDTAMPSGQEQATLRSMPISQPSEKLKLKDDSSGRLMRVDSEHSVDSGDQSRGASVKSGRSGRYIQIGDTGSVKSHYRNPAAALKAQEAKEASAKSGPSTAAQNLGRVVEEQTGEDNEEKQADVLQTQSALVNVVKEKMGQEDAGLFPEIASKRSSGPVDLDELYDEEQESFGEPGDFSWDEGSNLSSLAGGSPNKQSAKVTQNAVPKIRINTKDTSARRNAAALAPNSNKSSDSRSVASTPSAGKPIPKLRGPKRDTSPIRGRRSRTSGGSRSSPRQPEVVSVEKQQNETMESLARNDQKLPPIPVHSSASPHIDTGSERQSPSDQQSNGDLPRDGPSQESEHIRRTSPESGGVPQNVLKQPSGSSADENDGLGGPQNPESSDKSRSILMTGERQDDAARNNMFIQGPSGPQRSVKSRSSPDSHVQPGFATSDAKRRVKVPPRPERPIGGTSMSENVRTEGRLNPAASVPHSNPSGGNQTSLAPITPERSITSRSTPSKSPGDTDDTSFVSTDSRRSSVKLKAQFWESRKQSPEDSENKDGVTAMPSETAEWKSFLAKKVRAESAAANDEQQRRSKGRDEDRDSLFDFPESEGAFPKASRQVNRLPPGLANTQQARQIGGEPHEKDFEEISDLSPIRVQHDEDDEAERFSDTSSAIVQPSTSSSFLQRLQACAAPIMPRNNGVDDANCGAVPMAHLAFLRTNPSLNASPEKQRSSRFAPPNFCGRPDVIVEGDEDDDEQSGAHEKARESHNQRDKPRSRSNPRPSRQSDVGSVISEEAFGAKTAYLEAIAMKTAVSGSKKSKRKSTGSDTGGSVSSRHSEKWQRFLDKKGSATASSQGEQGSNNDVSRAAEKYAAEKVEEMMEMMAQRNNTTPFQSRPMEEATGAFPSVQNSRPPYSADQADRERKNDSSRAAEDLAAARVEAMMQALSGQDMEEGEI